MGLENQQIFNEPSEESGAEVESVYDEATKLNEINEYEKQNNVGQDEIAESYLAHVDNYKVLVEEAREAMDKFYNMERSNGSDNPVTHEAKLDWDIAQAKVDDEGKIMNSMLENLTKETIEKYKKDFELRGVFGDVEKR